MSRIVQLPAQPQQGLIAALSKTQVEDRSAALRAKSWQKARNFRDLAANIDYPIQLKEKSNKRQATKGDSTFGRMAQTRFFEPKTMETLAEVGQPALEILIGTHSFSVETGELRAPAGDSIHLRPQSTKTLQVLAKNLGSIVSKDDLIDQVWHQIAVTDDSLTQCIAEIRRALGKDDRKYLKTFSKRGYQLEAAPLPLAVQGQVAVGATPVIMVDWAPRPSPCPDIAQICRDLGAQIVADSPDWAVLRVRAAQAAISIGFDLIRYGYETGINLRIAMDVAPVLSSGADPRAQATITSLMALAHGAEVNEIIATVELREMAVDTLDCMFWDRGAVEIAGQDRQLFALAPAPPKVEAQPTRPVSTLRPTIAVLPLHLRLGTGDAVLGQIFAEDLISCLGRCADLTVITRLSTEAFGHRSSRLVDIRTHLNADYVVSGNIRHTETDAVINWELTNSSTGHVIQSREHEIPVKDLTFGTDFIRGVAGTVRNSISNHSIETFNKFPAQYLESYNLLFGAIGLMHRLNKPDFTKAKTMLDLLEAREPDAASRRAWIARWHVLRVQQGWSENPQEEGEQAIAQANMALDLDPENTLALTTQGFVLTNLLRRLDEAEYAYDMALSINPSDPQGALLRGMLRGFQGNGAAAVSDAEHALKLAPIDPHRYFFLSLAAGAHIAAENYERALELSENSLRLNRSHTSSLRTKIAAQINLGQLPQARETARKLLTLQPDLRVDGWLKSSPGADFAVGKRVADALKKAGIPN